MRSATSGVFQVGRLMDHHVSSPVNDLQYDLTWT